MEKTTTNIVDNTSKTLSIQVSLNGLSFCAINSNNEIIAIEEQNFGLQLNPEQVLNKIKEVFNNNSILKENFKTIEVIYQNNLYTIVPKPVFDKDHIKDYLKYNIKVLENDFIACDELNQYDIVTVYIPYTNINNFFFDNFGSFTYKHSTTVLIDTLLFQEKNNDAISVFAHMNKRSFDLIIINKGKLMLANTFSYETKEDFLYYLMFSVEQLQLNPEEFLLQFLGDITKDNDCYTIAYKYIRNISFGQHSKKLVVNPDIKPFEPQQHFVLLSQF